MSLISYAHTYYPVNHWEYNKPTITFTERKGYAIRHKTYLAVTLLFFSKILHIFSIIGRCPWPLSTINLSIAEGTRERL